MNDEHRKKLVDKFLTLAETFTETPAGMLFGAVAMVLETGREADFLHRNSQYFVDLLKEMHGGPGVERQELSYEEKEFFRLFAELSDEPAEEFPDLIG